MFASVLLLWLLVFIFVLVIKSQRPKNFPPGPTVLPIVGNIFHFSLDNPLKDFERLRKTYGDVYSLYLGSKPTVVVNGLQALKEALVNKGVDFAGRPQDLFINHAIKRSGIIMTDYGPSWRQHRRFALMTLRNFGLGKNSMEERIHGEIKYIVNTLDKSVGQTLIPQLMFHHAASNIICQVLFGTRYEYDDPFIKTIIRCFTENAKLANGPWAMLYDSLPMIRRVPLPFRKAFENGETCENLAKGLFAEHKKTRVPGEPRDFVDCYLDELDKKDGDASSFSEEQLTMYILDLHFAGTDTTSNTLLTAFLYLTTYPHVQERCQQEIDMVLEGKKEACFNDRNQMPYMQAVIHEVQRISNTVPLSVFHCTTENTKLNGYSIPKGTMIIPNLSSVLNEEESWKFPHEFNPENFLNEKEEFVKPEAFMPFSAGPRVCLGEGLARMELFLIMVTLLRKFKFIWPEDAGKPDYEPVYGVTLTPKPYRMKIQLRAAASPRGVCLAPPNIISDSKEQKFTSRPSTSPDSWKPAGTESGEPNSRPGEAHAPGVVLSNYTTGWKEQRRFGLMTLRNFGLGKQSMEERIRNELQYVIAVLEQNIGKPMNPHLLFHNAASNIICQVLFAKHFDYEDDFLKFSVGLFHETSKIINGRWGLIYDSIPLVRNLPLPFQRAFKLFKRSHENRLEILAKTKKSRVPGKPRHFIDCYLDEMEKRGNDGSSFNEDQLCALLLDLHFAGTDTTANTILSAILYLMAYPQIQERCQQEIDKILNGKDEVIFEDRHKMPYMQAVIHESQRMASTLPLSVFHCTTEDTELLGYSIPKGTVVIPNLTSVLTEKEQWKFPLKFSPENFLNEKGEFVKPEAFLPFSIGPRMCLGEGLARMELFLILVTLLKKFKFIWPEDAGEPDLTPVYGIVQTPKAYHMIVELR